MASLDVSTGTGAGLTTGVPVLDDLIDGVRVGDNIVVVADDVLLRDVGRAFVAAASSSGPLAVVAFEDRGIDIRPAPAHLVDLRGSEAPTASPDRLVERVDEQVGAEASFLIDSLDAVQRRWGEDAALEVFLTVCPQLYRRGSVAMWLLDAVAHDRAFMARVAEITQVVVRLTGSGDEVTAEVSVAAGRSPTTVGRRAPLQHRDGVLQATGPVAPGRPRLGDAIRRNRLARGMSQVDLARRVGITPSGLSQVERGQRGLAGETLIRIWEALGVPFGPQDSPPRGYRVGRRSAHTPTTLADGVTARIIADDPDVGRCWLVAFEAGAAGDGPLFDGKCTESVVITEGVLELRLEGQTETLHEGDSVIATHAAVDAWGNPGPAVAVAYWYVLR